MQDKSPSEMKWVSDTHYVRCLQTTTSLDLRLKGVCSDVRHDPGSKTLKEIF